MLGESAYEKTAQFLICINIVFYLIPIKETHTEAKQTEWEKPIFKKERKTHWI